MKTCKTCGHKLPIDMFYKNPRLSDGMRSDCKDCLKEYRQSYGKSESGADAARRGSAIQRVKNPQIARARNILNNSIRAGMIDRPDVCEVCGDYCKPHAHHWSYEDEHALDVQWVCIHCHVDIHHDENKIKEK